MESDVGHTIPAPGAAEYLAAARVSLTYRDKLASLDGTIQNKPTDSEKGAMSLGGSGAMGLISKLPPIYMKAHLVGEGVAGVFSSLLRLLTIIISPSTSGAAFLYFGTGSALMIFTTIIFLFATKTKFFRYYTEGTKDEAKESLRNHKDIIDVLKIIWPLIILPLFGMLIPTTSIINLVVSQYNGTDNIWGDKYFVTICSYLVPALAGLFGRGLFNYLDIDLSVPLLYLFTITKDGLSGSLICLSNAKPRHNLTVIVNKDWEYALLTGAQAMSSGFFINLFMMKILRSVPPNRIELAMMITMFFLSLFSAITSPLGVLVVSLL
ncbi:hypothetical protein D910_12252 [Dendroctonus ponderosae]|uniref:Uncharacterized protein n=1 Tax=Dendroctonus ponderosae TaxID=77166 RepID=U4UXH1_DENPD|nr:hypothetical protein D910_12252 [Dendroctonus ponderosae]